VYAAHFFDLLKPFNRGIINYFESQSLLIEQISSDIKRPAIRRGKRKALFLSKSLQQKNENACRPR